MSKFHQDAEAQAALHTDTEYLLPVYARYPVVMERGVGVYLYDSSGHRYLDLMAGMGVNALGHAHPRMVATMCEQAGSLIHLSPQYVTRYAGELAERLCDVAGMTGAFFSTGGAEAVEGALKLARAHALENFSGSKPRVVALLAGYHGRTYGSQSVTGQEKYRAGFEPGIPGVDFVPREDMDALRAAVTDETCAIIMEPVLGEGGVYPLSAEYLREARRLADTHRALLIFDEIQCGLGRTGAWFAFERANVRPDVLLLGKPLGGGLPLSAMLVTADLFHTIKLGGHASTLGGSPLACRLGLEFLRVVEQESLLEQVTDTGNYLRQHLDRLASSVSIAKEARGVGLLQALELTMPGRPLAESALEQGLMLNVTQGNILRFLPPFLLTRAHVDTAMAVIEPLLAEAERAAEPVLTAHGRTA